MGVPVSRQPSGPRTEPALWRAMGWQEKMRCALRQKPWRNERNHTHAVVEIFGLHDFRLAMETGEEFSAIERDAEFVNLGSAGNEFADAFDEGVESGAGVHGDELSFGELAAKAREDGGVFDLVDLVEDDEGAFLIRAEFVEDLECGGVEFEDLGL